MMSGAASLHERKGKQMKLGLTLTELATEIERQQNAKADYIASTSKIEMVPDIKGSMQLFLNGSGDSQGNFFFGYF